MVVETIEIYPCDLCDTISTFTVTNSRTRIKLHYCDLHFSIYCNMLTKSLEKDMNEKEKGKYYEKLKKCGFRRY